MIVTSTDKARYIYPVKKIMNVRFTQIRLPQAIGLTLIDKMPISISGIVTTANFFHTLNTRSEKMVRNNKEAEIKEELL